VVIYSLDRIFPKLRDTRSSLFYCRLKIRIWRSKLSRANMLLRQKYSSFQSDLNLFELSIHSLIKILLPTQWGYLYMKICSSFLSEYLMWYRKVILVRSFFCHTFDKRPKNRRSNHQWRNCCIACTCQWCIVISLCANNRNNAKRERERERKRERC